MCILTSIFVFFSLVVPSLAQGEEVPEDAVLMQCSFAGEDDSWMEYKWETVDSEGTPSIFSKVIGAENPKELIVDGEKHEAPHPEAWVRGATGVEYKVTFYTEKRYHFMLQGKVGQISWESTNQVTRSQGEEKRKIDLSMENPEMEGRIADQ